MFQPTTFGKYFLTRRIAVGGMAEVYSAKLYGADGFEKDLVIKQILPQHARDPEFVQSFVAEAKIAVGLSHANIVAIYELGRVDGTYFIAMEFVDGLDGFALLEASRRHGLQIPVGVAARIVEDVAAGLDYAHRRTGPDGQPLGLVHRDLNPRNVLISRDGEVKVLDFGIAKTAPGVTGMPKTRAGVVKGTTGYMSPEQAMGLEIDARTDIYQAGLLLFEMLTGQALFWRPNDEETRNRMRDHVVVAPSTLRPDVPPALDRVVHAALHRDPAERYQTSGELADSLMRARADCPGKTDHGTLGALVRDLQARDERAVENASGDNIPATRDVSEAISSAIDQSLSRNIETFARSGWLPEPTTRPITGSTPVQLGARPAPRAAMTREGHGGRDTSRASSRGPGSLEALPGRREPSSPTQRLSSPPQPPPRVNNPTPGILVTALLLGLLTAGGFAVRAHRLAPETAPLGAAIGTAGGGPKPAPANTPTPSSVAPTGSVKTARLAASPPLRPARPAPVRKFGVVDFGTRSCSSRVSIDGRVVTRTTPSFGHRLRAGEHSVVIEGVSCPPVERPGSLQQSQPTIRGQFTLPAGGALKVIADFDDARLHVRPVQVR